MITSSNFFQKTFFTLQPQTENQPKGQVGPWQQQKFPKFSTIEPKQQKRNHSLMHYYDPLYLDYKNKASNLKNKYKKQLELDQFTQTLDIFSKNDIRNNMFLNQKSDDFDTLPPLSMRNHLIFKQSLQYDKNLKNTLVELQYAIRKMNSKNNINNDNLNFIRKSQQNVKKRLKKQSTLQQKSIDKFKYKKVSNLLGSLQSFNIYQKSVKKHRYLKPILTKKSLG